MSEDKLIPSIFQEENKNGTFVKGGIISGIVLTVVTLLIPFDILWNVISM